MKRTFQFIYTYDSTWNTIIGESKEFNTLSECIKEFWKDKKNSDDFKKYSHEPTCYYRIRINEYVSENEIEYSDYKWTKRGNKIYIHEV